jgi:hypothetical protein
MRPSNNINQGELSTATNESQIPASENSVNEGFNTPTPGTITPAQSKGSGQFSVNEVVNTPITIMNVPSQSKNSVQYSVNEAVNTPLSGMKAPSHSKARGRPRKHWYMSGLDSAIGRMKRYRQQ